MSGTATTQLPEVCALTFTVPCVCLDLKPLKKLQVLLANGLHTLTASPLSFHAVCIEKSRDLLGQELAALVGESYERAYLNMVRVQQLTELEETVEYSLAFQLAQGTSSYRCTISTTVNTPLHMLIDLF